MHGFLNQMKAFLLIFALAARAAAAAPQLAGCPVLPADNVWNRIGNSTTWVAGPKQIALARRAAQKAIAMYRNKYNALTRSARKINEPHPRGRGSIACFVRPNVGRRGHRQLVTGNRRSG